MSTVNYADVIGTYRHVELDKGLLSKGCANSSCLHSLDHPGTSWLLGRDLTHLKQACSCTHMNTATIQM